jgi:twinfilin-like protein
MDLPVDADLIESIKNMDRNNAFAIIAIVEDEKVKQQGHPIPRSDETDVMFDAIRIACMRQEAAFVIVKTAVSEEARLVLMTSENSKPKTRMLVAATARSMKEKTGLKSELQISNARELTPKLFEKKDQEAERQAAMSESEKIHKEIAAQQAKELQTMPQRVAMMMPGVALQLADDAVAALKELQAGDAQAVLLACEDKINVKAKLGKGATADEIVKAIPTDAPRYLFARWPGLPNAEDSEKHLFFVYTVPVAASPKAKAPYMGTKMTLLSSLEDKTGVKVTKRVEVDDPALLDKRIKESLEGNDALASMAVAPEKKITMVKGARMFMPE